MPNAVLRITAHNRHLLDQHGIAIVRVHFAKIARRCLGCRVVLYQSARGTPLTDPDVGYFATARVVGLYSASTDNPRVCAVYLSDIRPIAKRRRMLVDGRLYEKGLMSTGGYFDGRRASDDLREVTEDEFVKLAGYADQAPQSELFQPLDKLPKFRTRLESVRNPDFTHQVYRAYHGVCAISGVPMLFADGYCGLEAAHIFPYASLPLDAVTAGILLAPSWHKRFDHGGIIIHDDYTWYPVSEDGDTEAIKHRRLLLPSNPDQWPDRELLQKKRQLFGFL